MSHEEIKPRIVPMKSISAIWLVPIVAVFIGIWMIVEHYSNQGPLITIHFVTGDGIEEGKTKVKTKNVEVGIVEEMLLDNDLNGVSVNVRMANEAGNLLAEDSRFWVVRPKVGKGGISGLGTLLSGAFIELAPGGSVELSKKFIGLESSPVTPTGTPGIHITLDSHADRALEVGDPIFFHGFKVGRIELVFFNSEERIVYYNAFVESPYDKLITSNTKFWLINGFELDLSADGINIQTGTLESMISGGVSFDVPNDMPRGRVIADREYFTIYKSKSEIHKSRFEYKTNYVLLFEDSIRGLKVGAPVEYRGIRIGSVIRTDINYDEIDNILNKNSRIPVVVAIEPARLGYKDTNFAVGRTREEIQNLLKSGLRGGLETGNLLTGSKYIELTYDEDMPYEEEVFETLTVIPTQGSQLGLIVQKLGFVMDKFINLPLEPVLISAKGSINQLNETLQEFQKSGVQLEKTLRQSAEGNLVGNISELLNDLDSLILDFSEGSRTHIELQSTLISVGNTFKELKPLLNQLNQKPNSLIFSNKKVKDIVPGGEK